ncbi:unnamed protein product, partial [Musa textilis]
GPGTHRLPLLASDTAPPAKLDTGLPSAGRHSGRTRPWAGTRPAIGSLAAASREPRPRGSSTASASATAAASGGGRVHQCSVCLKAFPLGQALGGTSGATTTGVSAAA